MIKFTIYGQAASKANSRKIVAIQNKKTGAVRAAVIKSDVARQFEEDALRQIPPAARQQLKGELCANIDIYYRNERPDLDESIVLDVLQNRWAKGPDKKRYLVQKGVYENDRQVREKHVRHFVDPVNPRVVIEITPRNVEQAELFGAEHSLTLFETIQGQAVELFARRLRNHVGNDWRPDKTLCLTPNGWLELRRTIAPPWRPELLMQKTLMGYPIEIVSDLATAFEFRDRPVGELDEQ